MKHSIHSKTLANGAKLHVIDVPDSQSVEIRLYFEAGFQYFDKDTFHVPHLLEHLILGNGGKLSSEQEMTRALQTLGGSCNATTDFEHVTVLLSAPATTFTEALDILLSAVFSGQFSDAVFNREKEVVLRELHEQYDGLDNRILNSLLAQPFKDLIPEDWTHHLERVEQATPEEVQKAYQRYITPGNMRASIGGPLPAGKRKELETIFSKLPAAKSGLEKTPATKMLAQKGEVLGLPIDLGDTASLVYSFVSPITPNEPHRKRASFNVTLQLLFNSPNAILPLKLREQGIVYSVDSDVIRISDWQVVVVTVTTAADKAHLAATEILKYLKLYAMGYIPEDDFDSIKQFAKNILSSTALSVGDLVDWYSGDVVYDRHFTSVEDEIEVTGKITSGEVAAAAKELFVDAKLFGAVTCKDAVFWAPKLGEEAEELKPGLAKQKVEDLFASKLAAIEEARRSAPERVGYHWAAFWFLMFITWITTLFVSNLPATGGGAPVTVFTYATEQNRVWGAMFWLPYFAAAILTWVRGSKERVTERISIGLMFVAALVYAYGALYLFNGLLGAGQPLLSYAGTAIQLAFFFVAAPLAFISLIRLLISNRRK